MYVRETDEYERLYSLNVLGVEDRGEDDQLVVYKEFQESISEKSDGGEYPTRNSVHRSFRGKYPDG